MAGPFMGPAFRNAFPREKQRPRELYILKKDLKKLWWFLS